MASLARKAGSSSSSIRICTYEKLLLIEPSRNRTKPVTTHAAWNKTSGPNSGKLNGMITYPNSGIAPKDAKEQNMTKPAGQRTNTDIHNDERHFDAKKKQFQGNPTGRVWFDLS